MKIFLMLNQAYPFGYALTKRFHLYAKGLISNGVEAKIIIPHPTEKNATGNLHTIGNYDGVPFEYTWSSTRRSNNFWSRRHHDFMGMLNAGKLLKREKPDVIILSTFSTFFYIYLKVISLFSSFIIIKEKNEIDFLRKDQLDFKDIQKIKFANSFFDGYIVINNILQDYLNYSLKDKKPKIIVPILIEDFTKDKDSYKVKNTIVYTGTYHERKDGILSILKAFSIIRNKFPYRLVLTGSPENSKEINKIKEIIKNNNLENDIDFTGYIQENDLHNLLISAGILILAKPENRQNTYNFPTKIGEYLVSGRPVIATKVGIIGNIMEDRKNIIFAEYDVDDIAKKMEILIENPVLANEIGKEGKEFALENFNYVSHAMRMIDFFKSFKN